MQLDYRSIPYRVFENTAQILTGFVLLAVVQGGASGVSGLIGILLVMVLIYGVYETAYVQAYEYRLDGDTVDIKSGVVSKREREIPFERIQNVDIAQNAIQRVLGIAEVRMETAGGGESEARLRYVSRQEASRLQELISRRKRGDTTERDPGASDDILFELSDTELGILGITSANVRLLGLLSALVVFGSPVAAEQVSLRLELLLFLGPVLAIVALVLLWAVSGVQAVLRYYGFRLLRHDEELRYERGLLQRYNGTIPLSKIQTLMWYLAAALWVLVPPAAHLKWVNLGYHFGDRYVITQSGFWSRRTTIVPYYRIQTVANTQSIFQRRHGLATLVVDTATSGGYWGGDVVALDIDAETAEQWREEVQTRFQQSIAERKRKRAADVLA